jgi:hypothetical protein
VEARRYVVAVVEALEAAHVPYMIVGSLSASAYGITRSTKDADFVLDLGEQSLVAVLNQLGPEYRLDRQMAFETNTGTVKNVVWAEDSGFMIELFRLSSDPHDRERFNRRRSTLVPQLGRHVFVPTPEDVVITKLRWVLTAGRSKDRDDVAEVLAVQRGKLDWPYIEHWCDQHGTRAILEEIRAAVPEI